MGLISRHRKPNLWLLSFRRQWPKTVINLQIRNNFQPSRFKIRNNLGNSWPRARPFWSPHLPPAKKKTNSDLRHNSLRASIMCSVCNAGNTTIRPGIVRLKKVPSYLWMSHLMARVDCRHSPRNSSIREQVHLSSTTCLPALQTICTAIRPSWKYSIAMMTK